MKKIKVIGVCILFVILIGGIYFYKNKKEYSYYLVIGDYLSNDYEINGKRVNSFYNKVGKILMDKKKVKEVNNSYVINNITSKKLLEMIEKGVYVNKEKGLVELIKKSKYMTITLGINDLIKDIRYDSISDNIIYDKEVIKDKIEILKHNYYKIIEEIKEINNECDIVIVGNYLLYGDDKIVSLLEKEIKEVSLYYDIKYVSLSELDESCLMNDNRLYLNDKGHDKIKDLVIAKILNKS